MLTTYVLGAGFSRPGGLPLGDELFAEVIDLAKQSVLWQNFLRPDLLRYILFVRRTSGRRLHLADVGADFEHFMSFLDIEHTLRLTGSNTWTNTGNKTQLIVRNLIAKVLYRGQWQMNGAAKQFYDDFARKLDSTDYVVTFNYDTVLEDALNRVGVRYRLFPARFKEVDRWGGGTYADDDDEVAILKMHGSIDWFDRSDFDAQCRDWKERGWSGVPLDEVFSTAEYQLEPLIDGVYPPSPLTNIYRVRNLNRYLSLASLVRDAPVLISPSFSKILYINPVSDFWYSFGGFGSWARKLVIIGFSMPSHDEYVQQGMYSLVRNFQHVKLGKRTPKSKLKMIDFRRTKKAIADYKRTYGFVDWRSADLLLDGFNSDALSFLFGNSG